MWPEDDEDEELSEDGEELDEEELFERVEAAFREERARIRTATNRAWLERLRETYADQIDDQTLEGIAAVRGGDLIELIDDRLAEIDQRTRQPPEVDGEIARLRAELVARDRRDREAAALRETEERRRRQALERERAGQERAAAARRTQERAQKAEAEQRAAARLANAKAAEIEARAAVLRAQAARPEKARVGGADPSPPARPHRIGPGARGYRADQRRGGAAVADGTRRP